MSKAEGASVGPATSSSDLQLDRVVLGVREGVQPGGHPPVRIFLGTESAQYRADRVLVWSIERVRDPSRVYEITVLKDLPGFDRRGWTTSFTNYRFAIPHLLGGRGRAIYNDEDQIYLGDPAKLFDLDLGDCGYRAVSALDTSVMLLDAAKMAKVWTLEDSQRRSKKALLDRARGVPGLYGELDACWNIRDQEVARESAGCLHYTTLHTQPWRPFPERFVYDRHPDEGLWFDLEREANEAGFRLFRREAPSRAFAQVLLERRRGQRDATPGPTALRAMECEAAIRRLMALVDSQDVLEITDGEGTLPAQGKSRWGVDGGVRSVALDEVLETPLRVEADGILCLSGLDTLPQGDVGWVLDELFLRARRFVFARVGCRPAVAPLGRWGPPAGTAGTTAWWRFLFETAAARRPNVHWELALEGDPRVPQGQLSTLSGGRFPGRRSPWVWALGEEGEADDSARVLAAALGWPFETLAVSPPRTFPLLRPEASVLPADLQSRLEERPPDLVISTGPGLAAVSRALQVATGGRTRVVHLGLGQRGSDPAEAFDLHVVSVSARSFSHPNRVETLGPLVSVAAGKPLAAPTVDPGTPRPHLVLLAGGDFLRHRGAASSILKLCSEVAVLARQRGASLLAAAAGPLPRAREEAFRSALGDVVEFAPGGVRSGGFERLLETGDLFVVAGEDEALLARACGTGRPVFIYPVAGASGSIFSALGERFRERVLEGARARPENRRGTTRPQKWGELQCSRWIAGGWVRPAARPGIVQRELVAREYARFFGDPLASGTEVLDEVGRIAARVHEMLGVAPLSHPEASESSSGADRGEVLSLQRRL